MPVRRIKRQFKHSALSLFQIIPNPKQAASPHARPRPAVHSPTLPHNPPLFNHLAIDARSSLAPPRYTPATRKEFPCRSIPNSRPTAATPNFPPAPNPQPTNSPSAPTPSNTAFTPNPPSSTATSPNPTSRPSSATSSTTSPPPARSNSNSPPAGPPCAPSQALIWRT